MILLYPVRKQSLAAMASGVSGITSWDQHSLHSPVCAAQPSPHSGQIGG